jgi:hypothetical protein
MPAITTSTITQVSRGVAQGSSGSVPSQDVPCAKVINGTNEISIKENIFLHISVREK